MIILSGIFSDHALFLHSSDLTVSGIADAQSEIRIALRLGEKTVEAVQGTTDGKGTFSLTLRTPEPSFDAYEIDVACGDDRITLTDVLFGELWMAAGQSNMELPNRIQTDCDSMLDSIQSLKIRAYQPKRYGNADAYPSEPKDINEGSWAASEIDAHRALWLERSASATAWAKHLYEYLKAQGKADIPVGFADLSRGGANAESFLVKGSYEKNKRLYKFLRERNRIRPADEWNTKGEGNFQQMCCQYNLLVHHTLGVKYRGILWYQGEANLGKEYERHIYGEFLRSIRDSYKEKFAQAGDIFPMVSSQIFPYHYGKSGDCLVSYINRSIEELGQKYPKKHPYVPVCDLDPTWQIAPYFYPIHPTHKYDHGKRMALLCENAFYGRRVKNRQTLPPSLYGCEISGGKIYLKFKNVGTGLYINGRKIKGLYIRSENGVYTPAQCRIESGDTLCVYHPYIKEPAYVAYAVSDFEYGANLFAGEFPIAPFATDMKFFSDPISVQIKSFADMDIDSEISLESRADGKPCSFPQPVFYPTVGTDICFDSSFSRSGRSLRLRGKSGRMGVYVLSRPYHELDLENYEELRVWVMNVESLSTKLTLTYDGHTFDIEGTKLREERGSWGEYGFALGRIPCGTIEKMQLSFELDRKNPMNEYVNVDCISLVPKEK